jgi:TetR/AcrR family transcriptional repressor of nem operon
MRSGWHWSAVSEEGEPVIPELGTREKLIEAARELFWAQGYAATGVKEILQRAGVKSGSMYYFFRRKEDLALAVLDRYKELLWPMVLQQVFHEVEDPIERVFAVLAGYRRMLLENSFTHGCPIGNLALELADAHPDIRMKIAENFTGWRNGLRLWLAEATDQFPEGVDIDRLATFLLTVMEGAVMQCRAYASIEPFDASVAVLRDYFARLTAD